MLKTQYRAYSGCDPLQGASWLHLLSPRRLVDQHQPPWKVPEQQERQKRTAAVIGSAGTLESGRPWNYTSNSGTVVTTSPVRGSRRIASSTLLRTALPPESCDRSLCSGLWKR